MVISCWATERIDSGKNPEENLYAKTEEAVFFPQGSDPATLRVGSHSSIFLDKLGRGRDLCQHSRQFIYLLRIHSTTLQANKLTLLLTKKKESCGCPQYLKYTKNIYK